MSIVIILGSSIQRALRSLFHLPHHELLLSNSSTIASFQRAANNIHIIHYLAFICSCKEHTDSYFGAAGFQSS